MKTITITIIAMLLAVPAAAQDLPGSVEDLRALRAQQDSPIVKLNGNNCFVSKYERDTISCWPSRPEYRNHLDNAFHAVPWKRVAITAGVVAAGAFVGVAVANLAGGGAAMTHVHDITGAAFGAVGGGALAAAAD